MNSSNTTRTEEVQPSITVDNVPDPVVVAEMESGRVVSVNPATEELFRCDADDLVGRHQTELHPTDNTAAYREAFRRGLEGQRVNRLESGEPLFVETADGDQIPVAINVQQICGDENNYMMGVFREMSEQVERERALERSTNRLETLLDVLPVPTSVLDTSGVVSRWNQAAEEAFGYTADQIVGERYPLFTDDDEFEMLLERAADGSSIQDHQTALRAKDGSRVPVAIDARPMYEDGTMFGIMGTAVNLSDRRQREQQLDVIYRTARHNFRNELSVIQSWAETLEHSTSADTDGDASTEGQPERVALDRHSPVESIKAASDRLLTLSEEMVNIGKSVTNGTKQSMPQEFGDLVFTVSDHLQSNESVTEVVVTTESAVGHMNVPTKAADATSELFEHLLGCSDGANIHLRASAVNNHAELVLSGDVPLLCDGERTLISEGTETALQHASGLTIARAYLTIRSLGGTVELQRGTPDTPATNMRVELPQS